MNQQQIQIPQEAFYYFPSGEDTIKYDFNQPYNSRRKIFGGGVQYFPFETEMLSNLYYNINQGTFPNFVWPIDWEESDSLRVLQGCSFDITKSVEKISKVAQWQYNEKLYPIYLTENIHRILNSGFFYVHGRDNRYRPIIIINPKIFIKFKKQFALQEWGIGDWGLGIGDWGLGPIPNPQSPSPIPNPHS